ncbi:hypothetical protein [Treponema sp.]|uniref:hypothetical protein n=1 Tax=Treponema sp. TaxID=166 RepID=UPI003EFD09D8
MNFNKKKKNLLIPAASIFCLLYIILSVRPMSHEIHFTPEWTEDISHLQASSENSRLIPFRLAQNIGYFSSDGKITSVTTFPFKASISDKWYTLFSPSSTEAEFFFADGTKAGTIKQAGFPFFQQDRIYVMQPGGTSFLKCSEQGNMEWGYDHYSPITAFSSSKGGTVAGYADGTVISFLPDGKVDQKFSPGGSKNGVILGAAISEDGGKLACVSGQDQQRFIVAEKNEGHSKIIFHEYLEKSVVHQTLVKFSPDSDFVYFNGNDFLGIVNLKKAASRKIPVKGKISQIEFSDNKELVFILSKNEKKYTVTVLESFVYPMASFSFEGESAFIQTEGNSLFVGRNTKISKISISRK